ncbi:MAG: two-component system, NtrC family, response regulator AtoC [Myxococcales bacterium]|nr:two-component system, NtrC family, response regulator AtoC [Myxococcales bacterium]
MTFPSDAGSVRESSPTERRPRVLYADDEADVREVFAAVFEDDFDVVCVATGQEALDALAAREFDVLVSDMRMRPMKGSELLAKAYEAHKDAQRILLTGFSDHDDLAEAVNNGHLFAYMQKPWDNSQLRLVIRRAASQRRLELENRRLTNDLKASNARLRDDVEAVSRTASASRSRLLATSDAMQKVMAQVTAVAGTDASVLLHGETGTGKELIAAEIHERSGRRRARFVAQNLAALPPELMTSELFGHVKGAFTGAQQARRGLLELADGGTLFLDEIGEAPASLQALLLRALESREFWPVGASEPRHVDVRIVSATNRDLLSDAHAGHFRLDLYYRLAVCPIEVPPLRARTEDVRGIGVPLLEAAAKRMNRDLPRIGENAWRALESHPWPGNVRELGNVMERLVIYHSGRDVEPADLGLPQSLRASLFPYNVPQGAPSEAGRSRPPAPSWGREQSGTSGGNVPYAPDSVSELLRTEGRSPSGSMEIPPSSGERRPSESRTLPSDEYDLGPLSRPRLDVDAISPGPLSLDLPEGGTTFDDLEREILAQVLARADGNQSRAARSLGMSESTFRSRMKRLGLKA